MHLSQLMNFGGNRKQGQIICRVIKSAKSIY
jgi:hypothetical protein